MTVEGKPFSGLFNENVVVQIECEMPINVVRNSIIVMYISDDGEVEYLNYTFDGKVVYFEVEHFSQYAVDYELGAPVTVNLNGDKVSNLKAGWTVNGSKCSKVFPIGTTFETVMNDLGTPEMPDNVIISIVPSSLEVTADGMTITVEWFNFVIVAIAAIAVLFGAVLIGYTWYTMRGKRS